MNKKIIVVLNKDLSIGIAFNTLAHLCVSLGAHTQKLLGTLVLYDASKIKYLGMSKYPVIILKADSNAIKNISISAKTNTKLITIDFLKEMYVEYTDKEMKEAIERSEAFEHYGVLLYGTSSLIDKYTASFPLWR